LAASIRSEFDVEAELLKGDNGIFDVEVDGRQIFSKHAAGRFPENDEILGLLRQ
jgi:selT/selW/selH-like putative selenoprotein